MNPILTEIQGLAIILSYGVLAIVVAKIFAKKSLTNLEFSLAGRSSNYVIVAFSIAASWIWAPALFISAEKAYTQGLAGLFWFTVPNVLTLLIFGKFGNRLREQMPKAFTFPQYIRHRTSKRVHKVYLFQFLFLNIASYAVQILAGGMIVEFITGIPMLTSGIIFTLIALIYSYWSGLRASLVTDYLQMGIIIIGLIIILPAIINAVPASVFDGMGGSTGEMNTLFSKDGLWVAYSFGIITSLGLISGTVGDQTYWQRALSIKDDRSVKKAFYLGALIFSLVPIAMGMFGFAARASGIEVENTALVNVITVNEFLSTTFVVIFVVVILSGLISTLDSVLSSVSSIASNDMTSENTPDEKKVSAGKLSMVIASILGLGIALIPDIKILYLFLFYGTLRASTLIPSLYTLFSKRVSEKGMFWGLLISIGIWLPTFGFAQFNNMVHLSVISSVGTVLTSGLIVVISSKYGKN